jgi:phage shock protein B
MDSETFLATVIGVPFVVIVLPLWMIFHYGAKRKAARSGSQADQQELAALRDAARWMEQRIDNLERVLDTEAPGWRARSATR